MKNKNGENFNKALLTDLYQLTMMQGYFYYKRDLQVVFDYFFRRQPFEGGYVVFAGLETLIDFIVNFKFADEDIKYLSSLNLFKKDFLGYLKDFKFNIDLFSVPEGEIVFPNQPLIRVHGNIIEVQLLESIILNIINFQSLIATKTSRIVEAAKGRGILEFGLRRAQGIDGAISAARASYIGGAIASSNVLAGKLFNIPTKGTMAHSWVMTFDNELESFERYSELYPENTIILVDTYNTLNTGLPNAIKVLNKLKDKGIENFGIRLDSGDLDYLSKASRKMLDQAGLKNAKIIVSNDLDEYIIEELIINNSPIDIFGVGTNLVTAKGDPALTGVYKLTTRIEKNRNIPSIKISNDPKKTTNPEIKNILRFYNCDYMIADLVFMENERDEFLKKINNNDKFRLVHPEYDYKFIELKDYNTANILLKNIITKGKLMIDLPNLIEIQANTKKNLSKLDPSYKRLLNPHIYKVSLSERLMQLKLELIKKQC